MPRRFNELMLGPERIEAMHKAYERACASLQLTGHCIDQITDVVALKILELAKAGETDPELMCGQVLAYFTATDEGE